MRPATPRSTSSRRFSPTGKNSRLYTRLVYEMQIAQDVTAVQQGEALGGSFLIVATAKPGHTIAEIQKVIDEELDKSAATLPNRASCSAC